MKKVFNCTFLCFVFILTNSFVSAQMKELELSSKRNSDNSVTISYEKRVPGTYYVNLKFSKLINGRGSDFNALAYSKKGILYTIKPID